MSKLPADCNIIIGDLVVNPGDEEYFIKLENVIYLFGALSIQNTTLKDMNSLGGLRYIAHFNQSLPVIQIVGNPKFEYLAFYDLENIITNGNRTAIIQDNHKDLFYFEKGKCKIFGDEKSQSKIYRMRLDATGNQCDVLVVLALVLPAVTSSGSSYRLIAAWEIFEARLDLV
ncbi:hypothetical protein GCK72_020934 [Caenorhabditis remanei]|uniref:Receptor L-domain domain-containing protein n=1 Tax=Caenorhabditis remanei TaxID=31234 RepID=A0A6A5GI68_CAERE|nr:hypothetical protein GCK72_020934 [Caenorhabditis remanei]KAF1754373.1 hypothetical protein GCK72_020934 [Caenorhabditis remanei]